MPDARLPPVPWISAALRATTERLVCELHEPGAVAPAWDEREWRVAQAVAAIHGIAPLLARRLPWRGPESWHNFLSRQHEHTRLRHHRILDVLARIAAAARTRGLAIVALKGVALHELGIYQPGERPMSDIDLLVHARDAETARNLIETLDYECAFETWKHEVFHPRSGRAMAAIGEHVDNPIKIELHTAVAELLPIARCDISELILPQPEREGLSYYRSKGALMAHLLLHAAGAIAVHGMRAIHLQDIARVALTMNEREWSDVLELSRSDRLWWALPPLALASRYFPASIPRAVLEHARKSCAWPLRQLCDRRTLTDVSMSDLRIRAFPGIEWSRSATDMLRYMGVRLVPSRQTIAIRKEYGSAQSLGADAQWVRGSQPARIARWLAGGRVRIDTMASVRAALNN